MDQVMKYYWALHQMPELSFHEAKTASFLQQALKDMGYAPVRVGETGLYADLCVDPKLPWLVFRADMDALPVTEETGAACMSENPGVMHACGHDAHMSMLLRAAQTLKDNQLPQNIRFLFQPAEEITSGAKMMIEMGALPENTVAVFGFHVWPNVPKGKIVAKEGPLMASSTRFAIVCNGKNAHCSKRYDGADALMTAAQIATRFHEAEAMAEEDGTVLFCGKFHSGTAHNIVASQAEMTGTLRTFSEQKRKLVLSKLESIINECAIQYGTKGSLEIQAFNPAVINPQALADKIQCLFPEAITDWEPALAAEDFARYQQEVPGMFLWLGVGDTAALHNGKFLVPLEVLDIGVAGWLRIANHKW